MVRDHPNVDSFRTLSAWPEKFVGLAPFRAGPLVPLFGVLRIEAIMASPFVR
jgi:hypothetical protein